MKIGVYDTYHGTYPISTLINYLRKETVDYIYIAAQRAHLHFFKELGIKKLALLPSRTPWLQNFEYTFKKKEFDVLFIGHANSLVHYRTGKMLSFLKKSLAKSKIKFFYYKRCSVDKWLSLVSHSKITICCTINNQLTPQIESILSAGSLCLVDELSPQTGLYEMFKPDEHLVTWRDFNDLLEKIHYYINHPKEAENIAKAGQAQAKKVFSQSIKNIIPSLIKYDLPVYFKCENDARSLYLKSPTSQHLDLRVNFYENMQEIHRFYEHLNIIFWETGDISSALDLADLPRFSIFCKSEKSQKSTNLELIKLCKCSEKIIEYSAVNIKQADFDMAIIKAENSIDIFSQKIVSLIPLLKTNAGLFIFGNVMKEQQILLKKFGFIKTQINSPNRFQIYLKKVVHKICPSIDFVPSLPRPSMLLLPGLNFFKYKK